MESFGTQYSESLISSLNYTLGRTSSAIQDRREVKIKPRGATEYSPTGAKTIEFTITDSSAYLLANTMKLQFKLVNNTAVADQDLEMLGPAHAVPFQSLSVKMAGQQVELIENYGKSYVAMDQLLPQASRVMNGAEGLPLIESAATSSKAAPIVAKQMAGVNGAPLAADATVHNNAFIDQNRTMRNSGLQEQDPGSNAIMKAAILADKYQAIPGTAGKNEVTVAGPMLAGIFATGYALPIPHVPLSVTLTLVPNASDVCVCNPDDGSAIIAMTADEATGFPGQRGRSNTWQIKDPELVCSMIVLNASVSAQFDKELASSGLVLEFRSYQMVTQAILDPNAQLAFHVAKSNITDVYFCFDHEFSALSGTVAADGTGATVAAPWFPVSAGDGNHQLAISNNRANAQKNNFNPDMLVVRFIK